MRAPCFLLLVLCSRQMCLVESSAVSRFSSFLRWRDPRVTSSTRWLRRSRKKHERDSMVPAESTRWSSHASPHAYPFPPRINIRFEEDDSSAQKVRYVYDDDDTYLNSKSSRRKPKNKYRRRIPKFRGGYVPGEDDLLTGGWNWYSMRKMMSSAMMPPRFLVKDYDPVLSEDYNRDYDEDELDDPDND